MRFIVRTKWTSLTAAGLLVVSGCALGVGEERADPPGSPPRFDGGLGGTGGEGGQAGWAGSAGYAGWAGSAGHAGWAGSGGFAGSSPSGGTGASAGTGGTSQMGGFGGGGVCTPGEVKDLGECGNCGVLRNVCDEFGNWTPPTCVNEKDCKPNELNTAVCGNCGTKTRVCNNSCEWGSFGTCQNQGCVPGATRDCMCSTNAAGTITSCCGIETCNNNCEWECKLKAGKECNWNGGNTWRCCDPGKWEWCLSSCVWSGNCAPCSNCSC